MNINHFRLLLQQIKKTFIALQISMREVTSLDEINHVIIHFDRLWVQSGPFKGMQYIRTSHGSSWHPKILGTYEKEVSHILENLEFNKYRKIIDVGCAEGYYLSGLALLTMKNRASPEIIGYDLSENALAMARKLLAANQVQGRVMNHRFRFEEQTDEPNFYLIDIEGDERELFQGIDMHKFRNSEFLIEIHEPSGQVALLNDLKNVFAATHVVSVVDRKDRTLMDFPDVLGVRISDDLKMKMMDEHRCYGNTWLFAASK